MSIRELGKSIERASLEFVNTIQNESVLDWPFSNFLVLFVFAFIAFVLFIILFNIVVAIAQPVMNPIFRIFAKLASRSDWEVQDGWKGAIRNAFWVAIFGFLASFSLLVVYVSSYIFRYGGPVPWDEVLPVALMPVLLGFGLLVITLLVNLSKLWWYRNDATKQNPIIRDRNTDSTTDEG